MKKILVVFTLAAALFACKGNENKEENAAAAATVTETSQTDSSAAETKVQYTCPMHPDVVKDGPGTCDKCGMDLEPKS